MDISLLLGQTFVVVSILVKVGVLVLVLGNQKRNNIMVTVKVGVVDSMAV